jgi:hypothetical protein
MNRYGGINVSITKKLLLIVLITFVMGCALPTPLHAFDRKTEMPSDMDQAVVIEDIVTFINAIRIEASSSDTPPGHTSPEAVDLSKAYKIYVGTNVFEIESNSYSEILSHLEKGPFIFEVPVQIEEDIYVANLQIFNTLDENSYSILTEDEREAHKKRVGTWGVSALFVYTREYPFTDYFETAASVFGSSDVAPILVGGLPGLNMAVALYPDDAGNVGSIVVTAPHAVAWEALELTADEHADKPLDYADIKERALRIPQAGHDTISGGPGGSPVTGSTNGSPPAAAIIASIFCLAAATAFVYFRRKKRQQ